MELRVILELQRNKTMALLPHWLDARYRDLLIISSSQEVMRETLSQTLKMRYLLYF